MKITQAAVGNLAKRAKQMHYANRWTKNAKMTILTLLHFTAISLAKVSCRNGKHLFYIF